MDNLCHTLTGAALAGAGLGRRSRFASAALVVAANLPDVDVLAFLGHTPPVALRRGMTHGIVAQALLPVLLTTVFVAVDRWRPPREPGASRVAVLPLLLACYAGVLSHVGMDWLNNYGVRLLMPLSPRWFYGDAVFIVDPWLWLILAVGVIFTHRSAQARYARAAVIIAALYVAAMVVSAQAARRHVEAAWVARTGQRPASLMVGPTLGNPLRKVVIVDAGDRYERGEFAWLPASLRLTATVPKRNIGRAVAVARDDPEFRAILIWARFPYYETTEVEGGTRVMLADARFGPRLFSAVAVVPD